MATAAAQRSSHNTDTEYNLPNDSTEHARLEAQAAGIAEIMHNKVIHAPLTNPDRLLDIGCGTGAVTNLLGTTYPTASKVFGMDLSPVPHIPRPDPQPTNIEFIQGDVRKLAETDERFRPESLDFVFSRLLVCGMTDWAGYIRDTVVPLLKPGTGWAEVQDLDYDWFKRGRLCGGADWRWLEVVKEGARKKGLDLWCGGNAAAYMREAGLVDVSVRSYSAPFGTWAVDERPESRRLGALQATELAPLYAFLVPRMVEGLGLSEGEVEALVKESQGCLKAEDGLEWFIHVTVGRRPS